MTSAFIPLVRARAVEQMPVVFDRLNLRFAALRVQAGLPDIRLDRDETLLPLREVLGLIESAARKAGRETLAIDLHAAGGGLDALGPYARMIVRAPTLHEAIRRASMLISWHTLGATLRLERRGDTVVWRYDLLPSIREGRHHAQLFAGLMMRDLVRLYAGPRWTPIATQIHTRPAHRHELHDAFGERILFGGPGIGLAMPDALLSSTRPGALIEIRPPPVEAGAELPAPLPDFIGSLRSLIRSLLPAGYPDAAQMARMSRLPLRSFQRLLAMAGFSFSELVDQTRLELALELMRDPGARMTDVAFELAYSDPANFTRAFRRWTGVAPRDYRQRIVPASIAPSGPAAA